MIDHRMTSASNPQADGLAERCVQSIKSALSKCVLDKGSVLQWDEQLQWIALGYRCSKQQASGFSPYALMYGCEPCIPPAVKDRYRPGLALVFDTEEHREQAANYMLMRAELLQKNCTIAMHNLRSAQHRDTLRYRQVRSGLYRPSHFKFNIGDYIYVKRQNVNNTLMSEARPGIFRCLEVRDSGVLVLQGKCGSTMEVNQRNCAPCMLMNVDGRLNHAMRKPGEDEQCIICGSADDEAIMLVCDGCGKGYHTYCLTPPLPGVPDAEVWVCPPCETAGVLVQSIVDQRVAQGQLPPRPNQALMFPNAAQRAADSKAAQLNGRPLAIKQDWGWADGALQFVHRQYRPDEFAKRPLQWQGEDGDSQWLTESAARKLLAADAARPRQIAAVAINKATTGTTWVTTPTDTAGVSVTLVKQLPDAFDLGTIEGCMVAGGALFPGKFDGTEAALMRDRLASVRKQDVQGLFGDGVLEWGVGMLLQAVDLRSCVTICSPCHHYGNMKVVQTLIEARYQRNVLAPDVGPTAPITPQFYKGQTRQTRMEWVFLFVPAGMEELALSLADKGVTVGVALLCPRAFMTTGPAYRQRLMQSYMDAGRLAVVSQEGQEYIWVCVFATSGDLHSMCDTATVGTSYITVG